MIGAGPIGIAAAIGALDRGFDVTVVEKGEAGEALRSWGSTRFFSPFSMNVSPRMRELLGAAAPPPDSLLTAAEMIDLVLRPLSEHELLRGRIRTGTRVVAIGRRGLSRTDYAGHPLRYERPFRIVLENDVIEADVVLDASGGLSSPNAIGAGGLPARGESSQKNIAIRSLGALEADLDEMRGKRVLLVGNGHSAANAIVVLARIATESAGTHVTWAVRSLNRRPCTEVANDPLPERQRIVASANALAETPPPFLSVERRAMIEALEVRGGAIHVSMSGGREVVCDRIAAFTGYHPNGAIHSELAVDVSPVTEGSAKLYRAIANVTDCLSVPQVSPADLASGEPDFWFIGSRSYGRARTFLLQTGLSQLETILQSIRL